MKACVKCGSTFFKVPASYYALDYVELTGEPDEDDGTTEEYEITDIHHGDGEWLENLNVQCGDCGHEFPHSQWDKDQDPDTPKADPMKERIQAELKRRFPWLGTEYGNVGALEQMDALNEWYQEVSR